MIEDDKKNKTNLVDVASRVFDDDSDDEAMNFSWSAVSKAAGPQAKPAHGQGINNFLSERIDFAGKNLEGGKFSKENLANATFSVANLKNIDFSNANLKGTDFSGADLSGANLSGANLEGAVFDGANLGGANFTGANLKSVTLKDADITDAILLDIEIDELGLEELQELIEYLAKYFPHKLNLTKINLTLLDLSKIDLTRVSLRGVDFTGCNMTGVNILELDLSECIISPEQIAQALGKVPNQEEMAKILAPKPKAKGAGGKGANFDFEKLFIDDGKEFGVMDATRGKATNIKDIIDAGKKVFKTSPDKPKVKDEEALSKIKEIQQKGGKSDKEALIAKIEENKRKELERLKELKKEMTTEMGKEEEKTQQRQKREMDMDNLERARMIREREM